MAETEPNLWRLTLSAKSGPDAGKTCVVERDIITVGKLSDCDLVLSDSTVSRRHLRIARTKDPTTQEVRWVLADLGSTTGTFLGETRVQEEPIEAGAVLKAGKVELAFSPERQAFTVPEWPEPRFGPLIGKSRPMRELFGMIARIAPTEATVLIQGDTGTGKGLVAKAIHQASARASHAYMVVDCGAVQRQLIESELFGHEKGAFTGA